MLVRQTSKGPVDRPLKTLQRRDIRCLHTLRAALCLVAYLLVLCERLETIAPNFRKAGEEIVAASVRSSEAKAFAVVEPLNGTGIHEESLR